MNAAKMTLVSTVVAAAFGLALSLSAAPALAVNCLKNPNHRDCGGDAGGGGGRTELHLEALLVGVFQDLPNIELKACETSGVGVGPFDDPEKDQAMNDEFDRLVMAFPDALPLPNPDLDPLPLDQLFGFGKARFDEVDDDLIQIQLQNAGAGIGAVNRILLMGPPDRQGNQGCDDGNETETIHGGVWLFIGRGVDDCQGVDICVTGFMVRADLDNKKSVVGKDLAGNEVTHVDPIPLQTATCEPTVVPIFERFFMRQQGKKDVEHGTLSYGEIQFWVLPDDKICPES